MSINSSQEKVDSYLVLDETGIRMVRTSMLEFGDWHTIRFDSSVAQRTRPLFPTLQPFSNTVVEWILDSEEGW